MLQQTQVKTVIPYWERWMRELPDIKALAQARPEKVLKLWEGLGYYSRARNAQRAAQIIQDSHGGIFPCRFDDVLALPGIGRYTAGAICSIAFNQPTPILDGNVIRVLSRVFGVKGVVKEKKTNAQLWRLAQEIVNCGVGLVDARLEGVSDCALQIAENFPFEMSDFKRRTGSATFFTGNCSKLNQALMELGALVCLPKETACAECPLTEICFARRMKKVGQLPQLGKKIVATRRRFLAFVVERQGRFLVVQRPEGVVNGRLWEFPNVEIAVAEKNLSKASLPFAVVNEKPIVCVKHSITRYRIQTEAYRAEAPQIVLGEWRTLAQIKKLAFTGAHRNILGTLDRK